jgi:urease accessory protein
MKTYTKVLGFASDPKWADHLHKLVHEGKIEYLLLGGDDALRKRLRAKTDKGTECLIAIPRDHKLTDGAILELGGSATVVKMTAERWLTVEPANQTAALELGYFCGNLHWRVRFRQNCIEVALEGPEEDYLQRLEPLIFCRKAKRVKNAR